MGEKDGPSRSQRGHADYQSDSGSYYASSSGAWFPYSLSSSLPPRSSSSSSGGSTHVPNSQAAPDTKPQGESSSGGDGGHGGPRFYAAFIIPPLIFIALVVGLVVFLRKRKRRQRQPSKPAAASKPAEVREYAYRPPGPPPPAGRSVNLAAPIILSDRSNNAYLTGLDTSSQGSIRSREERRSLGGTTFVEPPPPYEINGQDEGERPVRYSLMSERAPTEAMYRSRSPFEDPEHEIPMSDLGGRFRSPFEDPPSPLVSEMGTEVGSRVRLNRRDSDVSDL